MTKQVRQSITPTHVLGSTGTAEGDTLGHRALADLKADLALNNVDNTSDATKNSATATLTNKTINLANNTLQATSAQLAAAVTDETGTGALVFASSPALAGTPTAPTAAAGTNTTQVATTAFVHAERTNTATLTNKTINLANNTLQATSAQLAAAVTDETGTGALVFANSPALTSPVISGGTIDNAVIGGTTPAAGTFTTLTASGVIAPNVQLLEALADARLREAFRKEKSTPIAPSLLLDFEGDKQLDPRITFTRASTARYYDGKTVTKAEENLLLDSQDFSATWTVTDLTSVTGKTAPNATATATEFTASAANGTLTQAVTAVAGDYTFSVFLRRVTGTGNVQITAGSTWATQSITSSWARYTVTQTLTAGSRTPGVRIITFFTDEIEIWGAQFEQRSAATAYTPTTTQIVRNFVPTLLTAAAGVARFDHNPVTGESLGLLIEEQRTNLLVRSEEFDNASWAKSQASVAANTIVAPDGTLTADKLVEDTSVNQFHAVSSASATIGNVFTCSVFVKAAERSRFMLREFGANPNFAVFNILTGVVIAKTGAASASIAPVGNGWWRIEMGYIATNATIGLYLMPDNATGVADRLYTGDGFSGIFIWGAQLEAAATPSSYIPTTSATVTRSADSAVMTGANFSSWFRADEGTLYTEASRPFAVPSGQFPRTFELNDGTSNNSIRNGYSTNTTASFVVVVSTVNQAVISPSATVSLRKLAGAYKVDDFAASANGGTASTDTSGTIPVVDRAVIGSAGISAFLNGHIRKIAYYTSRLPNATLQAMTS